jgi:quercetin dioxygenase-like cupin family protein
MSGMSKPSTVTAIRSGREPHPLTGTALRFDLATEAEALKSEPTWQANGHNAKTLVKHEDVRVVLIALKAGARMQEHQTDQCMTLQTLDGRLHLHLMGETVELPTGSMIALDHTVLHDVEAQEDSIFLLTLGWSKR